MPDTSRGLDEQLKEKLANTGSISSADLQAAQSADQDSESPGQAFAEGRKATTPISSDEEVEIEGEAPGPEKGKSYDDRTTSDKFLQQIQQIPDYLRTLFDPTQAMEVEVTPADKEAYYDSLIQNTRFKRTYKLLDGRLMFTLQGVTESEIRAYWSQYAHESARAGQTAYEHRARSRDLLLSLSVCSFKGDDIAPADPKDLLPVLGTDVKTGKPTRLDPPWIERAKFWEAQSPGLLALMFKCYREFEFLYWRLVAETKVENF